MTSPLLPQQIREAMVGLDGWEYDGVKVSKVFKLKDFPAALVFTNRVGAVAEQLNHHPDIHLCWNTVTLVLTTHDVGVKVTAKDIALAHALQAIPLSD